LFLLSSGLRLAYLVSYAAVYGPFVAMATYAVSFVSCTHCKQTSWQVLPAGPGLIPSDFVRRSVDLPRLDDTIWFGIGFSVAAAMVAGLAWLLATRTRWWQAVGLTTMLALNVFGAIVVLALIRA
jgi:hypothetical protein